MCVADGSVLRIWTNMEVKGGTTVVQDHHVFASREAEVVWRLSGDSRLPLGGWLEQAPEPLCCMDEGQRNETELICQKTVCLYIQSRTGQVSVLKGRNDGEPINLLSLHLHPSTRQQTHHDFMHSASIFMVCGAIPPDSNRIWSVTPSQWNHKQCLPFFHINDVKDWYTAPRSAAKTHVKNKNMITVDWDDTSPACLFVLKLWFSPLIPSDMERPHYQLSLSHRRKIISAWTAADAATDIITALLWFLPKIESAFIHKKKKKNQHRYLWVFQGLRLRGNNFLDVKDSWKCWWAFR